MNSIIIKGAKEHNLKNISVTLPREKLIVITGLSGSGKSSLAFDTLYAEGQRRYVESLSSFARQFLGQMPKPDVDYIGGLSPSISISFMAWRTVVRLRPYCSWSCSSVGSRSPGRQTPLAIRSTSKRLS